MQYELSIFMRLTEKCQTKVLHLSEKIQSWLKPEMPFYNNIPGWRCHIELHFQEAFCFLSHFAFSPSQLHAMRQDKRGHTLVTQWESTVNWCQIKRFKGTSSELLTFTCTLFKVVSHNMHFNSGALTKNVHLQMPWKQRRLLSAVLWVWSDKNLL